MEIGESSTITQAYFQDCTSRLFSTQMSARHSYEDETDEVDRKGVSAKPKRQRDSAINYDESGTGNESDSDFEKSPRKSVKKAGPRSTKAVKAAGAEDDEDDDYEDEDAVGEEGENKVTGRILK